MALIGILLSDADVIAVLKPSGLPSQPDPSGDLDLHTSLQQQFGEHSIGLVHRLDRPVSGVMIFGRTPQATAALSHQFQQRSIAKVYWAIVEGAFKTATTLAHYLSHNARSHKALVSGSLTGVAGPPALLAVKPLAIGDRYTLVEVQPQGGAFHQIRAQLGAAGYAIKGDVKYGARRGEKDRSIALHARSIAFQHPRTDEHMNVVAPPPSTPLWQALVDQRTT